MKTFHIICAGQEEVLDIKRENGDFVIACDGGFKYALQYNVKCDMVLGDFDSLGFIPALPENQIKKLPCEKDDTDTFAAVKLGLENGYDNFVLYAASGGEIDHTLANISALIYIAQHGKSNRMTDGSRAITAVCNGEITFDENARGKISVLSADKACRVKINGLKYEFDGEITNTFPIGVSNEFIGKESRIKVCGTAIIVYPAAEVIQIQK